VRLLLFHPGPARIECGECARFVYDLDTGEKKTYAATVDGERVQLPQVRPKGSPTPCNVCPKQSPAKAVEFELSEKNWAAYAFYLQARAVGLTESERVDPIVRKNFAIIDAAVTAWEMNHGARLQAAEFARLFAK
jgi:hypothetical protein